MDWANALFESHAASGIALAPCRKRRRDSEIMVELSAKRIEWSEVAADGPSQSHPTRSRRPSTHKTVFCVRFRSWPLASAQGVQQRHRVITRGGAKALPLASPAWTNPSRRLHRFD